MNAETKDIFDNYQKENFVSEHIKTETIKEEFSNFLDVVMKNDVTIRDVVKVINTTLSK